MTSMVEAREAASIRYFNLPEAIHQARADVERRTRAAARAEHRWQRGGPWLVGVVGLAPVLLGASLGHVAVGFVGSVLAWCAGWAARQHFAKLGTAHRALLRARQSLQQQELASAHKFIGSLNLGRSHVRVQDRYVLALFPQARTLYLYSPASGHRHALVRLEGILRKVEITEGREVTLSVQCQLPGQAPHWSQWSFGQDLAQAKEWRTLLNQAAMAPL